MNSGRRAATLRSWRSWVWRLIWVAIDAIAFMLAGALAIQFRLDQLGSLDVLRPFLADILIVVITGIVVAFQLGIYRRSWRHASVPDFARLALAVAVGTGLGAIFTFALLHSSTRLVSPGLPRSFWLLEPIIALTLVGLPRYLRRLQVDWRELSLPGVTRKGARALLYGAGRAGALIARSAIRQPGAGIIPVGFLDDDPTRWSTVMAGVPVLGGLDHLKDAARITRAEVLLITMPSAGGPVIRRVTEAALDIGLRVRTVPALEELFTRDVDAFQVREVRVEDLLRRESVTEASPLVSGLIAGKQVLVTGAGGSIGSELARQLLALKPASLVLLDRAEGALYDVQQELTTLQLRGAAAETTLTARIADVADRVLMRRIFMEERPDIVFHAAAYKHVPLMEDHPVQAVQTNVLGTQAVLQAAQLAGVTRFVFVSTDKAVSPSSVMGATKRVGELLVADASRKTGRPFVAVRFGNVLGSSGSVVPLFKRQIQAGGPLTLTHPEVTRYFMTIPEAVTLILHAAGMGQAGDLFVLDMGMPVRIYDLALDLLRLSGRDPSTFPIVYTGLRPGEKLHESLYYDAESVRATEHPMIMRAVDAVHRDSLCDDIERLVGIASAGDPSATRSALAAVAGITGTEWSADANNGSHVTAATTVSSRATKSQSLDLAAKRSASPSRT